ncbi:MAG TPA: molybdopterin dinucleotide binding domain-containing protein [Egicoccus sp.]|nr:molybdopterin dinucleotide binding domain-containing protein [Egicoccus sp.]HSK22935.1 molybdopterin dinucleotide binding domain-containing protein [Egicoccus sp.]
MTEDLDQLAARVSAARADTEARGETFYPGPSKIHLAMFPPKERWDDWVELDSKAWPRRVEKRFMLVPTTCFNCESACGLLAYVDKESLQVRKFEGNPEAHNSRGRNCAKGPAVINQVTDPDRILYPMKRVGERGAGGWERIDWDEALDTLAGRIRTAIVEERANEVMYHVGRPGEDGFTERVLGAWGVDGHNSHTNVCSSGGRAGYQFWMGIDRPSPDHANADVILLISAHLETGHYFNPHAQRITEARERGAKLVVLDVRLSNTATHADHWLAPYPGSEAAICLAIANHVIQTGRYDREYVRRWWNWHEYLTDVRPDLPATFEAFEAVLREIYADYTFAFAEAESGVSAARLEEVADLVASAGTRLSTHNWRSAAAGNEGGWQVSRTLFLLNALLGAVAVPGGTYPNAWNKFVAEPIHLPPHPAAWNELTYPLEYPLGQNELSFLLPHFVNEGRGTLDTYISRVYNPVWTNPDGFSWIEMLTDTDKVGLHAALTPTWSETAYFADLVLPMGLSSERHDITSYEQYDGQWIGFRQPVLRAARERLGEKITDTRQVNPGEVWEENEFWIELSWRIDPDGSLGIRQYFESRERPGEKLTVDEYYGWMFANSVPGLKETAEAEGLTPLDYMRRYGSYEVAKGIGPLHEQPVDPAEVSTDVRIDDHGRAYSRDPAPAKVNYAPTGAPDPDADGRRPVGVEVDGQILRGFPTPSGRLEFYSRTLVDWGWSEYAIPTYLRSHVHPSALADGQVPLISTFRLPTQIHTRSSNSKWLDELSHANPLWIHPSHAATLDVQTGDLVRVETELGYFVVKAWVTEGIRPGVVACSHHMGRWRLQGHEHGQRLNASTVELERDGSRWAMRGRKPHGGFESRDPDTMRIWWTDVGVHQNMTFGVHPDPISGMHCWHQAVRVRRADPGDQPGDIRVDTDKSREVYRAWLEKTRGARLTSPNGERRPRWLIRPLKPTADAFRIDGPVARRT